jgi:MFS family permease
LAGGVSQVGPGAAWRVIRSRNFGPYFVGNAASASGTWFQNLAGSILVFRLTHSAFLLGVLAFCQFAPVLLLVPWAGSWADRYDRRKLILGSQLAAIVFSAGLAALAWDGRATAWVVIGCSAALGVTSAISAPAQQALITSLVGPSDVAQAVALNSMTFNLARAIGPVTAAAIIATLGIPWAFALNSLSYLALVAGLLLVSPHPQVLAARASLRESIGLIRAEPQLAMSLVIVMCVGFGSDPVNTESPAFAHTFGYSDTWSGAIVGVFGLGAVTAAFLVAGRVAGSQTRMAVTLGLLSGGIALFALAPWLPLGFVFLAIAGFGYLASNTSATTRLQLGVAESHRGRVMALWSVAFLGLRPLASLADGALAATIGVRGAGLVLAVPALAGAIVVARQRPRAPRSGLV